MVDADYKQVTPTGFRSTFKNLLNRAHNRNLPPRQPLNNL